MSIPIGTTARQLSSLARWMLGCLVVIAMLAWPGPSLAGWGALTAGLLATLLLWLMWRTTAGDRTVPGHPVQWVLLGPAAILAYHLGREGLSSQSGQPARLAGALDVSMLFQLCLLSGGVMLSQSLLPLAAERVGMLSVCGAAMMIAPLAARVTGGPAAESMRHSLALLGFAGVGVWLSSLWEVGWRKDVWTDSRRPEGAGDPPPIHAKPLRAMIVAVAVVAAGGLTWLSPASAILAAGALGGVLLLGGLVFHQHRVPLLIVGGVLTAGSMAVSGVGAKLGRLATHLDQVGLFGLGEAAFGRVDAASDGISVLAWTIGWGGLCWLAGGWALCVVWLMTHARRRRACDRRRAIVWTCAAALSSCAMLSVGGLFAPAMVVAAAFTWGLLPQMLGRPGKARSGGVLLVVVVALALVVGVAKDRGLVNWAMSTVVHGPRVDTWMHVAMGLTLTMTLAWLMGARKSWLGLVGIAIAAAAGGLGELVQWAFHKPMDGGDWVAHLFGCAAAIGPYLLCVGARWCESPDAPTVNQAALDAYL